MILVPNDSAQELYWSYVNVLISNKIFAREKQNYAVDADIQMSIHRFPMAFKICHLNNQTNVAQNVK